MLEAQQGDRISGKISRVQVASVAVAAMGTEASIGERIVAEASLHCGLAGFVIAAHVSMQKCHPGPHMLYVHAGSA